jgi:hypothetical protein
MWQVPESRAGHSNVDNENNPLDWLQRVVDVLPQNISTSPETRVLSAPGRQAIKSLVRRGAPLQRSCEVFAAPAIPAGESALL